MGVPEARVRSHGRFESSLRFDVVLEARTGLHIGAGKNAALAGSDLPVLRDAAGRPLVPGSSLRGILRSGVEAVCNTLDLDRRLPVVAADPGVPEGLVGEWNSMGVVERLFGRIAQKRGDFSYASRLHISDCRCTSKDVALELRDGVAIDRELRTAAGGGKFDVEAVPSGTRFSGSVKLTNADDHEVGLVAQALWMLDQGMLLLGGKSARGLGWMKVRVGAPRVVTARSLLDGRGAGGGEATAEPAEVAVHFDPYLDALRELADAPPAGDADRPTPRTHPDSTPPSGSA